MIRYRLTSCHPLGQTVLGYLQQERWSFHADRSVAAKRIAYFRYSVNSLVHEELLCHAFCRETASSALKAIFARQVFLAARSSVLARLETGTPRRHTRNCGPVAAGWIPLVSGVDLEGQEAYREAG